MMDKKRETCKIGVNLHLRKKNEDFIRGEKNDIGSF
jgi:hypothetical protein